MSRTFSSEEMAAAEAALEQVRAEWLQREGVTAVDLGFKWRGGQMTDQLAIRVHVVRKRPLAELSEDVLFPRAVDGIPVDVIEAVYGLQSLGASRPEAAVEGRDGHFDPIPLGVSIGSPFTTAGTLGARVIDRASGQDMILSNWHILAGSLEAEAGLPIWQPGQLDATPDDDNIFARLSRWVLGPYDAAVAHLTGARSVSLATLEGTVIDDIIEPGLAMRVWKSGRTTGRTEGFIDGVKMQTTIAYGDAGTQLLEEVCRIIPRPGAGTPEISLGGDSGSIWVDEASGKAVGLHFAGESGDNPEHALAHNLRVVTKALNIRFPRQKDPVPVRQRRKQSSFWQPIIDFLRRLLGLRVR